MKLFAKIVGGFVEQVIVADSIEWCETRLGGDWVETFSDSESEQYAGIGMGYDSSHPARFASPWVQVDPEEYTYSVGSTVFHDGRIWESKVDENTSEPGSDENWE